MKAQAVQVAADELAVEQLEYSQPVTVCELFDIETGTVVHITEGELS
jgi:hypothetical protein